jgi:hypothetical protein
MQLADETTIEFGHEVIRLRASLRAAFRLDRRYGFDTLVRSIIDGNLTVIADVIRECAVSPTALPNFLDDLETMPLHIGIDRIRDPLIAHVMALAGADGDGDAAEHGAERIPFPEYFTTLFRLATGWLGWSPAVAWDATPAEITEAYKGKLKYLEATLGSGTATDEPNTDDSRHSLNAIGDLTNNYVQA